MHGAKEQAETGARPQGAAVERRAAQHPKHRRVKPQGRLGREEQIEKGGIVKALDKGQKNSRSPA